MVMIKLGNRERSALLVMVAQHLGRLRKGSFDYKQVLNIAEWMLGRIDGYRENSIELDGVEYTLEKFLLVGYISLDEYVSKTIHDMTGKRLKQIAEDWYGMKEYGKYFGDF